MNVPASSEAPARSASPSRNRPRSYPPAAMAASDSSRFGPDRLRVHAPEVRVALLVYLVDGDAPAGEQPAQPAGAGAPERIDEDADVGGPEGLEIHRPFDEPLVAIERVEPFDETGRFGVGQRAAVDRDPAVLGQSRLDGTEDLGAGGRAGRSLDLEPVVDPGVVTRGDDDAGGRPALDDLVRAHLGWDRMSGDRDRDVVGQQHLGSGGGEVLGGEPPVVGDDHALGGSPRAVT